MTKTGVRPWGDVSSRLANWVYGHRYAGLALFLGFTVSALFSEAFSANELQTQVTNVKTLVKGDVAKVVSTGAVVLGGAGAMYAGQMMVGLAILGTLMLVCVAISIIDGDFKAF